MRLYEMNLVQYGVFDSRIKFPKIFRTVPRTVAYYEIELYTEDQSGVCYLNDLTVPLKKGTVICAKPGQIRSSKLHFRCINMHLEIKDPTLADVLNQLPDYTVLPDLSELTEIFQKILRLDLRNFPEQRLLLYTYTYQFIYQVISEARSISNSSTVHYAHRQTMRSIELYIREHLDEPLDLQTLAQKANLSAVYFHRLFSAHTGMSPAAFVLNSRIAASKAMLKTGELSIAEISSRCGFTSQSYFNYKFKGVTGETPLQYRKARLSRLKL